MIAELTAWTRNPITWTASALVAVAAGVSLWISPPLHSVDPPSEVSVAKVGGYCATVISAADGAVWALAPGAVDGKLKNFDPGDVNRTAAECAR